jgi:cell wall-associated NlpC family hydrolase
MLKPLIPALLIMAVLTSCSSLKPLGSANNAVAVTPAATPIKVSSTSQSKDIKFLDDISVTARPAAEKVENITEVKKETVSSQSIANTKNEHNSSIRNASIEKASSLQLKYAVLPNTEVELLENDPLLEHIDEWYGTRYRMGGTTKSGIDCSAFVQTIYFAAFAVSLPRTARDQYRASRIISATELKEGDLVFFNTIGGISHVGIYLQNNKFVHASSSNGVIISDLFEPYYLKRYIGAGRVERPAALNR